MACHTVFLDYVRRAATEKRSLEEQNSIPTIGLIFFAVCLRGGHLRTSESDRAIAKSETEQHQVTETEHPSC